MIARHAGTLHRRQWVPRPLDDVFAFFARPENLAEITPSWLGFRLLTPGPLVMRRGLEIDYRIRVLGWPIRWRSAITAYDPPHAFCDVQVRGPYRRWEHCHRFHADGRGTLVEDVVRYEPPLGPFGVLLDVAFIRGQLATIFDYRQRCIEQRFGAGPVAGA